MDDAEFIFENSTFPLNDQLLALADFGDISASQWNEPFEEDKKVFSCLECNIKFTLKFNLMRHQRTKHGDSKKYPCPSCTKTFARPDYVTAHLKTHKKRKLNEQTNTEPAKRFRTNSVPGPSSINGLAKPRTSSTTNDPVSVPSPSFQTNYPAPVAQSSQIRQSSSTRSAFKNRMQDIQLLNTEGYKDIKEFLASKKENFENIVSSQGFDLKVNCRLICQYQKVGHAGVMSEEKCFKTRNAIVLQTTDISNLYSEKTAKILREVDEFEGKESGWTLEEIKELEIRLNKFNPLRGTSYIELPEVIKNKQAIINVQNYRDNRCFMWAVLSALYPVTEHAYRTQNYEAYIDKLDFTGMEFPFKLQDIPKFEKLNSGISINVYGLTEDNKVFPLVITSVEKDRHVDLLYLKNETNAHYAWIKDLSRLVSRQCSKHKEKHFICRRCLQFFNLQSNLERHILSCSQHEAVRVIMPEDKWLYFKNMKHTMRVPFVMYCDFECLTTPISSCQPNSQTSFTMAYQNHEPISFCYYIASSTGFYKPPYVYRGPNAAQVFVERLKVEAKEIQEIYKKPVPMLKLTKEELQYFEAATTCYMCKQNFTEQNYKVNILNQCLIYFS